ncbi:MAG: hypothetical protein WAV05_01020 [Anaerolineales bacterium]
MIAEHLSSSEKEEIEKELREVINTLLENQGKKPDSGHPNHQKKVIRIENTCFLDRTICFFRFFTV